MYNIFAPHPYSTPVGILTERATDSGQACEDWALILEICDTINETDEGPKEAVRAIRKRISTAGKDRLAVWYTLLLLDACIRNCGRRFHSQIITKEFLRDFLKLLAPKNDPSLDLQNKVLFMLKSWVDNNWDVPGRKDLEKIYNALRQKGIQFPQSVPNGIIHNTFTNYGETEYHMACLKSPIVARVSPSSGRVHPPLSGQDGRHIGGGNTGVKVSSDSMHWCKACHTHHHHQSRLPSTSSSSTIGHQRLTTTKVLPRGDQARRAPPRSTDDNRMLMASSNTADNHLHSSRHNVLHHPHHHHHHYDYVIEPDWSSSQIQLIDRDGTVRCLNAAQRVKLNQDLAVVDTNVNVLNDMLAELRPDTIQPDDLSLLQDLEQTCRAMHRRVLGFVSQVSDEEVTPSLLQVADNLNNAFSRYDRFERYRQRSLDTSSESQRALTGAESNLLAITEGSLLDRSTGKKGKDDADDELLIDIGIEPNQESIDTDELAQWLTARQLMQSSNPTTSSNVVQLSIDSSPALLALESESFDTPQTDDALALVPSMKQSSKIQNCSFFPSGQNAVKSLTTAPPSTSEPPPVTQSEPGDLLLL